MILLRKYSGYKFFSTKVNGDELGFDFDILGRLRRYDTDTRESTFNYDGTKRFGDFDDGWKRYHWCKSQFLGYEDEANTFYIVPDVNGSTKVIFTHAGTIVNRLDYDTLGKIRNQDTTPQVELLWRGMFCSSDSQLYFRNGRDWLISRIYDPKLGMSLRNEYSEVIHYFGLLARSEIDLGLRPLPIPKAPDSGGLGELDDVSSDADATSVKYYVRTCLRWVFVRVTVNGITYYDFKCTLWDDVGYST